MGDQQLWLQSATRLPPTAMPIHRFEHSIHEGSTQNTSGMTTGSSGLDHFLALSLLAFLLVFGGGPTLRKPHQQNLHLLEMQRPLQKANGFKERFSRQASKLPHQLSLG